MDFSVLVDEIVRRVAEKLETADGPPHGAPVMPEKAAAKPKLLVLSQAQNPACHELLAHPRLTACYQLDCANTADYACAMQDYEAVILFDLTVDAMARLAGGVCDTPFVKLVQCAILQGKKIFVPDGAVELLALRKTVPSAYYQMLLEKLELLQRSGVAVCPADTLADTILSGEMQAASTAAAPGRAPARTVAISKRVITERDLAGVYDRDVAVIHIGQKSIVTDLAREYAAARGVSIVRD